MGSLLVGCAGWIESEPRADWPPASSICLIADEQLSSCLTKHQGQIDKLNWRRAQEWITNAQYTDELRHICHAQRVTFCQACPNHQASCVVK